MRRKVRRRAEKSKQDVCDWKPNPLISMNTDSIREIFYRRGNRHEREGKQRIKSHGSDFLGRIIWSSEQGFMVNALAY